MNYNNSENHVKQFSQQAFGRLPAGAPGAKNTSRRGKQVWSRKQAPRSSGVALAEQAKDLEGQLHGLADVHKATLEAHKKVERELDGVTKQLAILKEAADDTLDYMCDEVLTFHVYRPRSFIDILKDIKSPLCLLVGYGLFRSAVTMCANLVSSPEMHHFQFMTPVVRILRPVALTGLGALTTLVSQSPMSRLSFPTLPLACGVLYAAARLLEYCVRRLVPAVSYAAYTMATEPLPDLRPDSHATVPLKHRMRIAWVTKTDNFVPSIDLRLPTYFMLCGYRVSVPFDISRRRNVMEVDRELLSQICTPDVMSLLVERTKVWEKINMRARSVQTVNMSRYQISDSVAWNTCHMALALYDRAVWETQHCDFPSPASG